MRKQEAMPDALTRVRRARRQDIGALIDCVGGPRPGRVRALRRLLKTLANDVYVIDRSGIVLGILALSYRRSLSQGGVLGTIDTLTLLHNDPETMSSDLRRLTDCALERARHRGCVAIDSNIADADVGRTLSEAGFETGPRQLGRSLRLEEDEK